MKNPAKEPLPYFLLGAGVFLYLDIFVPPWIPVYSGGDMYAWLEHAARMLQGQVLYKDFFNFTFPGGEAVFWGLFKLFGVRVWVPYATIVALGVGLAWVGVAISRKLIGGAAAFLPSLLFLTLSFHFLEDATHHWFCMLAVMGAIALIMERRSPAWLAVAGALCAVGAFFTQSTGPAALFGFAVFVIWDCRRHMESWRSVIKKEALLIATFLATVSALCAYFIRAAGLRRFVYCTFIFVMKYYRADLVDNSYLSVNEISFSLGRWYSLPMAGLWLIIPALVPFVYFLFLVRYKRETKARPSEPWDKLVLLNIIGFCLFLAVAPTPAWSKLRYVSFPALIVFVWFIKSPGKVERIAYFASWGAAIALMVAFPWRTQSRPKTFLNVPTGPVAFTDLADYEALHWLQSRTKPLDYFFDSDGDDPLFLLDLRNPTELSFLICSDYTRPEQVQNAVVGLQTHIVQFVMIGNSVDYACNSDSQGDNLEPFLAYLRKHYRVVKTFADDEQIFVRRNGN